jgi:hypothetical protein
MACSSILWHRLSTMGGSNTPPEEDNVDAVTPDATLPKNEELQPAEDIIAPKFLLSLNSRPPGEKETE